MTGLGLRLARLRPGRRPRRGPRRGPRRRPRRRPRRPSRGFKQDVLARFARDEEPGTAGDMSGRRACTPCAMESSMSVAVCTQSLAGFAASYLLGTLGRCVRQPETRSLPSPCYVHCHCVWCLSSWKGRRGAHYTPSCCEPHHHATPKKRPPGQRQWRDLDQHKPPLFTPIDCLSSLDQYNPQRLRA